MPVVSVRALPRDGLDVAAAGARIGAAIAAAAGVPPTDIWVVWSDIAPGRYVIAGAAPASQPGETHPPLVEISSASGRSPEVAEAMMRTAADAIAHELGIAAKNVRVVFAEVPRGRLFSQGRLQ